jgi:hypothetical protein
MAGGKYFGNVAATAMHDMLNVLAGIKETVGLMEDLLCRCKLDAATLQTRFKTLVPAMNEQIGRGGMVAEALNRFGHQVGDEQSMADAASLARMLVALTSRKARGRRLTLAVEDAGSGPVCPGLGAAPLAAGLCAVLDMCYAALPPGGTLRLAVGREGEQGVVRLVCSDPQARAALAGAAGTCAALPEGLRLECDGDGAARLLFACAASQK